MKRPMALLAGSCLLVAFALIGCGGEPALRVEVPDRLTLYSIDGNRDEPDRSPGQDPEKMFHGYPILGKTTIDDPKRREALIAAFNRGIARSNGEVAKCFWPRHGLRLEKAGQTTDYLICFQCLQFITDPPSPTGVIAINRSPELTFNDELVRAGIPLAAGEIKTGGGKE